MDTLKTALKKSNSIFEKMTPNGWYWSDNFMHWQKRNKEVYCYITPIFGGFKAQLYLTGNVSFCELELQTKGNNLPDLIKVFGAGEKWLSLYEDGCLEKIHQDRYSISNPKGVWHTDTRKKEWVI